MWASSRSALAGVIFALAAGLSGAAQPEPVPAPEVLNHFKRDLQAALRAGMQEGPSQAVMACQIKAPKIASGLSGDGVRIGRTSHRLRNPANRGPSWVIPILDDYLANPDQRTPRAVQLAAGRSGYVEPIFIKPMCLSCHGATLEPAVAEKIADLYPEDQAVGFELGDLRGVFWVELPKPD